MAVRSPTRCYQDELLPVKRDLPPDFACGLDWVFTGDVAAVMNTSRRFRETIRPRRVKEIARAVYQDPIIVPAEGVVCPVPFPRVDDDILRIEDVSESEHDGTLRQRMLERRQGRKQLPLRADRHVIH